MRQKTIKIPIYGGRLTMIFTEDLYEVEKKYKLPSLSDYGAVAFRSGNRYRHYVVAFSDLDHLSNVAHEIVHIKNYIYSDCVIELDRHNDEPEAYLTGWLFDEIYKFLNPKK